MNRSGHLPDRISTGQPRRGGTRSRSESTPDAWTLPLFETGTGQITGHGPNPQSHRPAKAKELALHVYWSASVESHVLALAAMRAEYPDERRALLEIRAKEEDVRETAHRLLATLWHICIGAPDSGAQRAPRPMPFERGELRRQA